MTDHDHEQMGRVIPFPGSDTAATAARCIAGCDYPPDTCGHNQDPPRVIGACPVCDFAVYSRGDYLGCTRCDATLHPECYFGRTASMEEWREFLRQVYEGPEDYSPVIICAACRANGGRP